MHYLIQKQQQSYVRSQKLESVICLQYKMKHVKGMQNIRIHVEPWNYLHSNRTYSIRLFSSGGIG
jgi:hypothetical protein